MWVLFYVDNSFEINVIFSLDKDLFNIEFIDEKNIFMEDDIGESSQFSYDDFSMMRLYNEINRQFIFLYSSINFRQAVFDNVDLWNRVILEDIQFIVIIFDMDNDFDWDDCSVGVVIFGEG